MLRTFHAGVQPYGLARQFTGSERTLVRVETGRRLLHIALHLPGFERADLTELRYVLHVAHNLSHGHKVNVRHLQLLVDPVGQTFQVATVQ